jgi:Spy/CpxP family protein refolding chaperone
MRPPVFRWAVCGVLLLALTASLGAQSSFPWWKSEQFQKDLGLTSDQSAKIDGVFQATIAKLRQGKEELDRQEAELSRLIEHNADEAQVTRQVDRVETTRAGLNKMRTLMLFHMRQVLTADQNTKFKALHEKWLRDHPRHTGDQHQTPPKQ